MPAAKEKHEISLREAAQLSRYLRAQSREICKDNECPRGAWYHNCESYAYIRHDGRLLDVCASDYFQGESQAYAAVSLPWTGNAHELRDEIEEQIFEELQDQAKYVIHGYCKGSTDGYDDETTAETLKEAKEKAKYLMTQEHTRIVESSVPVVYVTVQKYDTDDILLEFGKDPSNDVPES